MPIGLSELLRMKRISVPSSKASGRLILLRGGQRWTCPFGSPNRDFMSGLRGGHVTAVAKTSRAYRLAMLRMLPSGSLNQATFMSPATWRSPSSFMSGMS